MSAPSQEFVLHHRSSRLVGIAAGALLLIAASISLPILTLHQVFFTFILSLFFSLGMVLTFGFTLVLSIRRLLNPRRALIITDQGLIDSASVVEAGLIPWSEIRSIRVGHWWWQSFICLELRNPREFMAQHPVWKQRLMRTLIEVLDAPVAITALSLPVGFDDLRRRLQQRLMTHHVEAVPDLTDFHADGERLLVRV